MLYWDCFEFHSSEVYCLSWSNHHLVPAVSCLDTTDFYGSKWFVAGEFRVRLPVFHESKRYSIDYWFYGIDIDFLFYKNGFKFVLFLFSFFSLPLFSLSFHSLPLQLFQSCEMMKRIESWFNCLLIFMELTLVFNYLIASIELLVCFGCFLHSLPPSSSSSSTWHPLRFRCFVA